MITIAGLGIGSSLPDGVAALVHAAPSVCVRTAGHPAVAALARTDLVCYDAELAHADAPSRIAAALLAYEHDVLYLVPGHPRVADATVAALVAAAPERCRIVGGVHPLDAYADLLGIHAASATSQWADALSCLPTPDPRPSWADQHAATPYRDVVTPAPVRPHADAWILNIHDAPTATAVRTLLRSVYRAEAACAVFRGSHQVEWSSVGSLPLPETYPCAVFLPAETPLDNVRTADGITYIIQRLLGPGGCPWDHEQTPQSLRRTLLEETYETIDAIDRGDDLSLREELGDVLLNILMQAEMARLAGRFTLDDVYAQVASKFIRRHPHVFGDLAAATSDAVLNNWYKIKASESGTATPKSPLAGVPLTLPALTATSALINKSKRYGMHIVDMPAHPPTEAGLGEQLFAIAVIAAEHNLDAEAALREINAKYRSRVDALYARDGSLSGHTQELWRDADRDA
ncbi:MAG: hypothetical protein RLZZ297_720 [Chloroflexota bacterium]|jgi:tetrapyrrole methylase family protein/MazG family protein